MGANNTEVGRIENVGVPRIFNSWTGKPAGPTDGEVWLKFVVALYDLKTNNATESIEIADYFLSLYRDRFDANGDQK